MSHLPRQAAYLSSPCTPSINNEYTSSPAAGPRGRCRFVPLFQGPCLRPRPALTQGEVKPGHSMTRPGQGPDLPVLLTDGWLLGWFKEETSGKSCPWVAAPQAALPAATDTRERSASVGQEEKGRCVWHLGSCPAPGRSQVSLVGDS